MRWAYKSETFENAQKLNINYMKHAFPLNLSVGIISLSFCLASQAQPISPGFVPSSIPPITPSGPVNLGMVFTPTVDISVNALGFYDTPGTTSETVTIYNSSQAIVAQTLVSDSGPVTDGYFWQSITPVALVAGDQYTVSAFTQFYWSSEVVPIVNSSITY